MSAGVEIAVVGVVAFAVLVGGAVALYRRAERGDFERRALDRIEGASHRVERHRMRLGEVRASFSVSSEAAEKRPPLPVEMYPEPSPRRPSSRRSATKPPRRSRPRRRY
jgi:hypothetical protein